MYKCVPRAVSGSWYELNPGLGLGLLLVLQFYYEEANPAMAKPGSILHQMWDMLDLNNDGQVATCIYAKLELSSV